MRKIKYLALVVFLIMPSITVEARSYVDEETPIEVQIACDKYGAEYGICPELLEAICWQESRFDESVIDGTGECYGLMQIKKSCHKKRMQDLGVTDLGDIDSNIHVGADYLRELFDDYEDAGIVLGLYHGESNAVARGQSGNLSDYVTRVLENSERLERLHGK